jgi:hypothetical protein
MNIIIRFCIVKKNSKIRKKKVEFTLKKNISNSIPISFAQKRKLSYKIIDHWHHPTFPKGLQQ